MVNIWTPIPVNIWTPIDNRDQGRGRRNCCSRRSALSLSEFVATVLETLDGEYYRSPKEAERAALVLLAVRALRAETASPCLISADLPAD